MVGSLLKPHRANPKLSTPQLPWPSLETALMPEPMNLTQIQDLIKFVAKSGVSEVEIEQKDFKITIKTPAGKKEVQVIAAPAPVAAPAPLPAAPAPAAAAPAPAVAPAPAAAPATDSKYITIKAPMIGTFYRSAVPGKPVFVNVGDDIKP